MSGQDWVTAQFEASRPRLQALAYRILGSRTDAEDAVQETWLRLVRTDLAQVDNLGGWLTTVTARLCLDRLRSRRARPEESVGDLPDDVVSAADTKDPADEVLVADSVGAALIMVLELLAPSERVAFVLHDVFAVPFDEIAPVVDRSPEAARQLASRARRRLQANPTMGDLDLVRQRQVVGAFLRAARGETSRRCSVCSIRTSCCAPTPPPCAWDRCGRPAAPRRWHPACRVAPKAGNSPSSMVSPDSFGCPVAICAA